MSGMNVGDDSMCVTLIRRMTSILNGAKSKDIKNILFAQLTRKIK